MRTPYRPCSRSGNFVRISRMFDHLNLFLKSCIVVVVKAGRELAFKRMSKFGTSLVLTSFLFWHSLSTFLLPLLVQFSKLSWHLLSFANPFWNLELTWLPDLHTLFVYFLNKYAV
ncbi:hypothetical protein GYMLUDRAFT_887128 [Collybiopsis luxurians FD-317 M1]|uniref:Uncharacterized protein n=1 Tax=Collybiopsis luxurians FD-317 M1 TaxID=944289 RepID=A0A0D0CAJ0_9AGAR|nr:hypothetical protein GYMLUDRAFT_887128 [Collybiopsis luxurians FD-317 M1]